MTAWLAMPAARLVCAISCAQPLESAPSSSHCHDAAAAPSGEARVQAGHACPDPGSLGVAAIVKVRHDASAAGPEPAPIFRDNPDDARHFAEPRGPNRTNRPPDDLIVPLRL